MNDPLRSERPDLLLAVDLEPSAVGQLGAICTVH
jgi:hypothetical protein